MAESSFSSRTADDLTAELTKAAQKSRSRCCRNRTTLERVVIWNRITCCSDRLNYASISMYDKNMFLMYQLGSIGTPQTGRQFTAILMTSVVLQWARPCELKMKMMFGLLGITLLHHSKENPEAQQDGSQQATIKMVVSIEHILKGIVH